MFTEFVLKPFIASNNNHGASNAFCINEKFYTYHDLTRHINSIRKALQQVNITSKNIGLVANDDIHTYASIFALWMEGLAYVPLHPLQPIDRSAEIIEQAEIEWIIDSGRDTAFRSYNVINSSILEPATDAQQCGGFYEVIFKSRICAERK